MLLPSWQLALRAERKSPHTVEGYTCGVEAFLRWCQSSGTVPEITKSAVQAFTSDLLGGGAEAATARTRYMAVRRFAAWLVDEGELEVDPLLGLKPPKLDTKVTDALTDDELRRLIEACHGRDFIDRRDEAIVRLMAETGVRVTEALGLRACDVNLQKGRAVVRRGAGGKGREVPFGPQTAAAIDRYVRARRTHRLAGAGPLWLGGGGQTLGYHGLDVSLKKRARAAGIQRRFHLHLLRSTAATRWLRVGGSEGGLMAVAGWSTRAMLDRYTRATASERAAAEARGLNLGDL